MNPSTALSFAAVRFDLHDADEPAARPEAKTEAKPEAKPEAVAVPAEAHAAVAEMARALRERGVTVAVNAASGAGHGAERPAEQSAPAECVAIAHTLAAVEARAADGYGLVVAVDPGSHAAALRERGADVVVASLAQVSAAELSRWFEQKTRGLPSALAHFEQLSARLDGKRPAVFLDYDGTLAPIVENPDEAFMSAATREVVRALAQRCPVAVVSGRGRDKVTEFVALDELYYAGSHGFDIAGPDADIAWQPEGDLRQRMAAISSALRAALADIDELDIEDKGFSIAVHFRRVAAGRVSEIEPSIDRIIAAHRQDGALEKTHGKKVIEVRPAIDWHKGRAVLWLLDALGLGGDDVAPLYLGDDVTDEDAFAALAEHAGGLGVLVSEQPKPSAASFSVRDPGEVHDFLARLVEYLDAR